MVALSEGLTVYQVAIPFSPLLLFSWDDHVNLTGERDFRQILAQTTPTLPRSTHK